MECIEKAEPEIEVLPLPTGEKIGASVLRLDKIHEAISGNKWYKLKEYLKDAKEKGKKVIVTFGGAFSNHIIATAAAARDNGFISVGIIRGEAPKPLSPTLQDALTVGMHLFYTSREEYRKKEIPQKVYEFFSPEELYLIDEGGYGKLGVTGAASIVQQADTKPYTHILLAVGTGTTMAGLLQSSLPQQQVIGISVFKNNYELENRVLGLLGGQAEEGIRILHPFHFGGYAKYTSNLIRFMNDWYKQTGIPSDFVYTGKLFAAFEELRKQNFFPDKSHVLLLHTGGLQGNRSLPEGTLLF